MIIVKANKDSEAGVLPKEEKLAEMATFHEELKKAGALVDASGLQASSQGWRIKFDGSKRTIADGPFTSTTTRDLIAGYTIIEANSKQEAIEWTKRYPNPADGSETEIEVRPLFEMAEFGTGGTEAAGRF
jgi:hypothetical protein